jgi:hypothetical protein
MQDWSPSEPPHQTPTAAQRLLAAIAVDDHAAFYAALPDARGDINSGKGQYLRAAAEQGNMLFMKELALAGADISYAAAEATRERSGIRRSTYWDDDDIVTRFNSRADETRYNTLSAITSTLQDFQKTFTAHIAPAESLKMQERILAEIEALKQEITEMRDGKPLEKPALRSHSGKNPALKNTQG